MIESVIFLYVIDIFYTCIGSMNQARLSVFFFFFLFFAVGGPSVPVLAPGTNENPAPINSLISAA